MIVLSLVSSYVLAPITSATADECRDDYHYDHRHDSDHHTKDDHRFGRRWNKVPVGIIIGSGKAFVGTPTVLDASRSFDQDGSIVLYEWDVDEDGTWDITTTDPVASTTFAAPGRYDVRLRVTDDDGAKSLDRKKFEVRLDTKAPVALADVPSAAAAGELVTLDASESFDRQGEIKTYEWDFDGDGATDLVTADAITQHAWTAAGTYTVGLVVCDYADNADSFTAQITVQAGADAAPEPPTGVEAADVAADEGGAVAVAWDASSEADVSEYRVYRGDAETGPFAEVARVSAPSFTDSDLTNGVTYYYVVTAVDAADQESVYSAVVSATPTDDTAPAVPAGLSAYDVPADEGHALSVLWTANTEPDLAGYRVTMTDTITLATTEANVPAGTETYTFDGLVTGRTYSFSAIAYDDAANTSGVSAAVSSAPTDEIAPSIPQDLVAYDQPGDEGGSVVLEWSANAESDLGGYTIYRATVDPGIDPAAALASAIPVGSVGAGAVTWIDSTVLNALEYVYVITSLDESGNESAYSTYATVEAADNVEPGAPLYVEAFDAPADQGGVVNLTWAPSMSADVAGYEIQVVNVDGDVVRYFHVDLIDSLVVDELVTGAEYGFGVSAHDAAGNVSAVVAANATPLDNLAPAAPAGTTATDVVPDQGGSIVVSWAANTEADLTGYDVTCYNDVDQIVSTRDVGFSTSAQFDGLAVNGTYSFDVTARDANGNVSNAARAEDTAHDEVAPDTVAVTAVDHPNDQGGVIDVAWTASTAADLAGYKVYRDGEEIADVTATSWTDSATGADARDYTVKAYDASGNLSEANDPAATALATDDVAPSVPMGVSAADVIGNQSGAVEVTFGAVTDLDLDGYRAVCFNAAGEVVATAEIAALDNSVVFDGLVNGLLYKFQVLAFDASNNQSEWSPAVFAAPADDVLPLAPSGLIAEDVADDNGGVIAVSWTASADPDVVGYKLFRDGVEIADQTAVTFTDAGRTDGTVYTYTVAAYDAAGNLSAPFDGVTASSADTLAPAAPTLSAHDTPGDNGGSSELIWTAPEGAATYTLYKDGAVLEAGLTSNSYTDAAALVGVPYAYTVKALDAAGNTSPDSNGVVFASSDNVAPEAPTGISATDTPDDNGTSIDVTWNAVADAATYNLYRDDVLLTTGITTTSFQDVTVVAGVGFVYTVSAVDLAGNESAMVGSASGTAANNVVLPIDAPTGLGAADRIKDYGDALVLTWDASVDGRVTGYKVLRSTIDGSGYVQVAETAEPTFTDTGLTPGTTYYYVVRASDGAGIDSGNSAQAAGAPVDNSPAVTTRYDNNDPSVVFTSGWWEVNTGSYATETSGGSLEYATSGTSAVPGVSSCSFTFTGTYVTWIGLKSVNRGIAAVYIDGAFVQNVDTYQPGETEWQAPVYTSPSLPYGQHTIKIVYTGTKNAAATGFNAIDIDAFDVTVVPDFDAPVPPSGVTAVPRQVAAGGAINLAWTPSTAADLAGYKVYRSTTHDGSYSLITTLGKVAAWVDAGLSNGTTYYYRIVAFDTSDNDSLASAVVATAPMAAPSGLSVSDHPGDQGTALDIGWIAGPSNVVGYKLYRSSTSGGSYTLLATLGNVTSFTDEGLPKGATRYYKLAATDSAGNLSIQTVAVSGTTVDNLAPAAPEGVSARNKPFTTGSSAVVWVPNSEADLAGYKVYRSDAPDGPYSQVGTVAANVTVFTDSGLAEGSTYYYRVSAYDNAANTSEDSVAAVVVCTAGVAPDQRVENSASSVVFTPGWWLVDTGSYGTQTSDGSLNYATSGTSAVANVSSCTFTFSGTYVTWIGVRSFNRGIAAVYVDGVFKQNVDCYKPGSVAEDTVWQAPLFTSGALPYGEHTIKIVYTGTKNPDAIGYNAIDVDAFDVTF